MSATHRIGLLLLVVLAFVLGNTFAGAQGETKKDDPTYEYLVNEGWDHGGKLGNSGWELIAVRIYDREDQFLYRRPKMEAQRQPWVVKSVSVHAIDEGVLHKSEEHRELQQFGAGGWQLVEFPSGSLEVYFKRPKQ